MPKSVDDRIVRMQFDNAQFEKKVSGTMKLLQEFEDQLQFKGAEKGIEQVQAAADSLDFKPMEKGISKIKIQFDELSAVAIHQINRIVDSVTDAGMRMAKSLTLDNVTAGFDKYTQKTEAVQTIMNATGKSVEDVNNALAKLQWFSDETSYSFVDMTSNVGKFTSAGVDLNVAVSAMQGIANAAADAGANSTEASRAMYNFSQALSRGYVQLIDWKSIENANMATITFKDTIVETAAELGMLQKQADGTYTTLQGNAVSATNFNENLKDAWFTNEVLLKSLAKYSAYSDSIYEVSDAFDTCADAMAATSTEGMELGARAFKAAQQAKTFTEAINATKDAVSSGWMKTFEIIFGNFNESVELWTEFTNTLWDVFASGADSRNALLKGGLMSGWDKFMEEGINDSKKFKQVLIDLYTEANNGQNELGITVENFEKTLGEGWASAELLEKGIDKIVVEITSLNAAELQNRGYTAESIQSFLNLKKAIDSGEISLEEFAAEMAKPSGRENLIQAARNAFESLNNIIQPVKDALRELIPPMTAENIYKLTENIKDFTAQFKLSAEAANTLRVVMKALFLPIKMVATALKVGITWAGAFILITFKLIDRLLSLLSTTNILDDALRSIFGDKYTRVMEAWHKITERLANAFNKVKNYVVEFLDRLKNGTAIDNISKSISKLNNFLKPLYDVILEGIVKGLEKIAEFDPGAFIDDLKDRVTKFISAFPNLLKIFDNIKTSLSNIKSWFDGKTILDVFKALGEEVVKLKDRFITFVKSIDISKIWDSITSRGKNVIGFFEQLGKAIGGFLKQLDPAKVLIFAFGSALVLMILQVSKVASAMTSLLTSVTSITNKIGQHLKGTVIKYELISAALIGIAAALFLLTTVDSKKLLTAAGAMAIATVAVGAMVAAMSWLAKTLSKTKDASTNLTKLTVTVIAIAAAMGSLAIALSLVADIPFGDFAAKLGSITVAMVIVVVALGILTGLKTDVQMGITTAIAVGIAMLLLAETLKQLANVKFDSIFDSIVALMSCVAALKLIVKSGQGIKLVGGLGMIASALAILAYAKVLEGLADIRTDKLIEGLINFQFVFIAFAELSVAVAIAGKKSSGAAAYIASIGVTTLALQFVIEKLGSLDQGVLKQGMASTGVLILALALITNCFKTVSRDEKVVGRAGSTFMSMSIAIGILSGVIALLGMLDLPSLAKGGIAVVALIGVMGWLLKASQSAKKVAGILVTLSLVMGMATAAIMLLTLPDWTDLMVATGAFAAIMVSVGRIFKNMKEMKIKDAITNVVSLGLALAAIGVAIKLLSDNLSDIPKAITAAGSMAVLLLAVAESMKIMDSAKFKSASLEKFRASAVAMMGFLVVIGASIALISAFGKNYGNILAASAAMSIAILAVAEAIKIMDEAKITDAKCVKMESAAQAMVGFILEVGIVLGVIGAITVDPASIMSTAAGLSMALLAISEAITIMTEANIKPEKVNSLKKAWLPMAGFIAELSVALGVLGNFGGSWDKIISSAGGLSLALVAIAQAIKMMDKVKNIDGSSLVKMAGIMALIVIEVSGALIALSKFDVSSAIVNAAALGIAINAIAFATNLLKGIQIGDALGIVIAIVPVVLALAYALTLMGQIDASENIVNIAGIALILAEMTVMMLAFNLLGKYITLGKSAMGAGALDAVILIIGTLLELIGWLTSNEAIRDNLTRGIEILKLFEGLTPVLIEMTIFMGAMAALGYSAQVAIGAVGATAGFDGIVLLMGGLVYALGSIMQDENAQKIAQDGLQFFKDLGLAIGEFFGNLVGGVATGLTNGLDKAADNLDNFINKLSPALEKMSDAGSSAAVENIKNLATALLTLTGNDLLSSITGSSETLTEFATELEGFAGPFKAFLEAMSDTDIDDEKIDTVGKAAEVLASFASGLSKHGGLWQGIVGETTDLKTFASGLADFAPALKDFLTTIKDVEVSDQNVTSFGNAAGALSEFANGLTRHGGIKQGVLGEVESLTAFANDLVGRGQAGDEYGTSLAYALVSFSTILDAGEFNASIVEKAGNAAKTLADFANALPSSGGKIEWLVGKKATVSEFVKELTEGGLAYALVSFSLILRSGDFDAAIVEKAANAASILSDFADNLYTRNDALDWLTGKQISLKDFGTELASFGPNFAIFADSIAGISIDPDVMTRAVGAMDAMNTFANGLYITIDSTELDKFGTIFSTLSGTYKTFAADMASTDPAIVSSGIANLKDFLGFAQVIGNGETDYTNAAAKWNEALSELAGDGIDAFIDEFVGFANGNHIRYMRRGIINFLATFKKEFDAKTQAEGSITSFSQMGKDFMSKLVGSIIANVGEAMDAGNAVAEAIKTQVESVDIDLSAVATGIVDKFGTSLVGMKETLSYYTQDSFGEFPTYLANALGINSTPSAAEDIITTLVNQLKTAIIAKTDELKSEFIVMASSSIAAFNSSLSSEANLTNATAGVAAMCDGIVDAAKYALGFNEGQTSEFYKIGANVAVGLAKGMEETDSVPKAAAIKMAGSVLKVVKTFFGIHSPSKVMRDEVGTYIVEGVAEGITENTTASEAAQKCAENILNAFKESFSKADLDDVTGDLEDQLWEKFNPDATSKEKDTHQMAGLDAKMQRQADRVAAMDAAYQATVQLFGAESEEAQKAYNEYLQAQIDMADLAGQMAEANKNYIDAQKDAHNAYLAYYYENEDLVKDGLLTSDELWTLAEEKAGYDKNYTSHDSETNIQKIINRYMKDIVNASIPDVEEIKKQLASLPLTADDVDNSLGTTIEDAINASSINTDLSGMFNDEDLQKMIGDTLNNVNVDDQVNEAMEQVNSAIEEAMGGTTMDWLEGIVDKVDGFIGSFGTGGSNLGKSLIDGLGSLLSGDTTIKDWAKDTFGSVIDGVKSLFTDETKVISDEAADAYSEGMQQAIEKSNELIRQKNEEDPIVLTPVLDLSRVQEGLRGLETKNQAVYAVSVDSGYTVAKTARTNNQNGSNSTVAAAPTKQVNFYQTNNSPKSLNPSEVYRNTKNLLSEYKNVDLFDE